MGSRRTILEMPAGLIRFPGIPHHIQGESHPVRRCTQLFQRFLPFLKCIGHRHGQQIFNGHIPAVPVMCFRSIVREILHYFPPDRRYIPLVRRNARQCGQHALCYRCHMDRNIRSKAMKVLLTDNTAISDHHDAIGICVVRCDDRMQSLR